jgi:WD40 repeat protein
MVQMLKVTMTKMQNDGWTYKAYSLGEPTDVKENNAKLFTIIPTALTMAFPDGTIRTGGFLLGISEDDGRSWKFLDGQAIANTPTRKRLLPDFPDDLVVDHDPSDNAATTGRLTFLLQSLRAQQKRTKELPSDLKPLGFAGKDSWGNDVAYKIRDADFELRSSGADGMLKTSDDIVLTCPKTPKPQPKSGKPTDDMPALGKTPTHIILGQHKGRAKAADFSPDGQFIVSGGGTIEQFGEAVIYDTASRKKLGDLEVEGGLHYLTDIAFGPRGQRIAAGSFPDRAVVVWDATSKNVLQRLKLSQYPNDVAFSPDGSLLAVAESGYHPDRSKRFFGPCDVSIWNLGTGERTFELKGNSSGANSASFSPDGKTVTSGGSDGSIRVWDLETGKQIRAWSAGASVADVVCLPDGNRVASTGAAGNVSIWQLKSGVLDKTLRFSGAKGTAIACDAEAGWIACADYRGIVRVWNNEGQLKFQFKAHDQVIQGLAFSGDGKRLVSASHDSKVIAWSMEPDAEVEGWVSASDVQKVPAKDDDEPKTTAEATNNE